MKFERLLLVLLLLASCRPNEDTNVYVCDSQNARRYHLRADCRGLSNCNVRIITITLKQAKEGGKTLCNWEK